MLELIYHTSPPTMLTKRFLSEQLPPSLASLAMGYLTPLEDTPFDNAKCGHYERCLSDGKPNDGLWGACEGGHIAIVNLMIANGADNWNGGLSGACRGGHVDLANLMIAKGAVYCRVYGCYGHGF